MTPRRTAYAATITRRDFLAATSASLVTASIGSHQPATPERPWYATMRRCGQLNLNERDPLTLDVSSWLDYWASLELDALLLNGGGIVAFYPTAVPYHHRSKSLTPEQTLELTYRLHQYGGEQSLDRIPHERTVGRLRAPRDASRCRRRVVEGEDLAGNRHRHPDRSEREEDRA
ncbi:MAG TPA: hypothetical protein VKE96_03595 [Vicinamibacterales bacterium]|nr:hypothetical protein [Vicinamibacterales bacterium]